MQTVPVPPPDLPAMAQAALRSTESPVVAAFLRWALDALDHRQGLDTASQARIRRLYEATHETA